MKLEKRVSYVRRKTQAYSPACTYFLWQWAVRDRSMFLFKAEPLICANTNSQKCFTTSARHTHIICFFILKRKITKGFRTYLLHRIATFYDVDEEKLSRLPKWQWQLETTKYVHVSLRYVLHTRSSHSNFAQTCRKKRRRLILTTKHWKRSGIHYLYAKEHMKRKG